MQISFNDYQVCNSFQYLTCKNCDNLWLLFKKYSQKSLLFFFISITQQCYCKSTAWAFCCSYTAALLKCCSCLHCETNSPFTTILDYIVLEQNGKRHILLQFIMFECQCYVSSCFTEQFMPIQNLTFQYHSPSLPALHPSLSYFDDTVITKIF